MNTCVICGKEIPAEGTQYCPSCWKKIMEDKDNEGN